MSRRGGNDTSAFNTSGLASNLPRPSDLNRWANSESRREESAETTSASQTTNESRPRGEEPSGWRRETSMRDSRPNDSNAAPSGWGSRPPRINRDDPSAGIDGVQDKFSRAFSRQSSVAEPPRDLPRNTRGDFSGGGFGRQDSGGFGRREESSSSFSSYSARREERSNFSRGGDFGESRRGFDSNPPPLRENSRNFGSGDRDFRGPDRDRDREGGGDFRREPSNRREVDNSWAEDSRFANKFGRTDSRRDGDDRGGRGGDVRRYDEHRRERDALNANYRRELNAQPLPTAPRATLSNNVQVPKENVFEMALKTAKDGKKQDKKKKSGNSNNANKEIVSQPDEEDKQPEKPAEDPKGETLAAVTTAVAQGLKGGALTDAVCNAFAEKGLESPMSTHGLMFGILKAVDAGSFPSWTAGWFAPENYGDLLKYEITNKFDAKKPETLAFHIDALYGVQEFCASKKFPKVEVKGKERRLIEVIFSVLSLANIIDVEALIGWADDTKDRDVPGRVDAIVQTTNFIATLRENDEEEEEEEDDEVDAPRAFVK